MLKILHLWLGDAPKMGGGGAGSMYRLHSNLRKNNIDSRILCDMKTTSDPYVFTRPSITRLELTIRMFTSRLGLNDIHRISSFGLKNHDIFEDADLVHFHGIHSGFISYLALPALTRNKPSIFTMRDFWALTGHCAFTLDCERWKTGCGHCPYPENYPPIKRDATRLEWKLKQRAFNRSKLTIISLSRWLLDQAQQGLLKNMKKVHISNGVDTETYKPLDKNICRDMLGIPRKRHVLLFSAVNLKSKKKGGNLLLQALHGLPPLLKKQTTLILLGNGGEQLSYEAEIQVVNLGYINNASLMTMAFSASDLFVFPSRAESFGQVILESMACGTPVVAQDIGPIPELVRHGKTGYLAFPENAEDITKGILQLLEDKSLKERMGKNCRAVAEAEYPIELEVSRHIDLYRRLLKQ
jgi:glycosyltransferase involved in cell wall biosynthesis